MELEGRVVVVTGAGGGIGAAIAHRIAAERPAGLALGDLDAPSLERTAGTLGAVGVVSDVATATGTAALVDAARDRFGRVDVFVANAGIAFEGGPELPDDQWDRMWRVNTLAHVRAARLLLPEWLDRGEGHMVVVASAAGLLSSHGSAPYAVTKHAAVAFAEWMSITYGSRGVGVTCVCPQGVRTNMLETAGVLGDLLGPEAIEPDVVADETVQAVREGRFLVLPHPEVARYEQARAADRERWLAGMRRIQASIDGEDVEMRDPRSS